MSCHPTLKIALEGGWDYSDTGMMHIYRIEEYVRLKKLGLPTAGIRVENYDAEDEIVLEEDLMDFIKENDLHPRWMEENAP